MLIVSIIIKINIKIDIGLLLDLWRSDDLLLFSTFYRSVLIVKYVWR
jgi:hypothetical protein